MEAISSKQILSNLYGLMMEINFHRADEEVLAELQSNKDPQIERHLIRVKQFNAKIKAEANKYRYQKAIEQFRLLKERSLGELQKLLQPQDREQLYVLFRKFDDLSSEDEAAILDDQELLRLMEILNNRADGNHEP